MLKVLISGAAGKMGTEAVKTVLADNELKLVGCIGNERYIGEDIGLIVKGQEIGIKLSNDVDKTFDETQPDILLDLTNGESGYKIITKAIKRNISCVTGSTGFSHEQLEEIRKLTTENGLTTLVVPNFAIGAVLMMKFAEQAGKYFNHVEIIEMHHEKKKDSPSGTAIKTAEMILKNSSEYNNDLPQSFEKITGSRGGKVGNINIHSIRLPGYVATQEVIFGGIGQTLIIKHETINRESFMPGVIFSIKKTREVKGYIYGLENLL